VMKTYDFPLHPDATWLGNADEQAVQCVQ
jgi:hypothetical protein